MHNENNILITGADGYAWWYVALHLANKKNIDKIICIDNYSKRAIQNSANLFPIDSKLNLGGKIELFNHLTTKFNMFFEMGDVSDSEFIEKILKKYMPKVIIHCAQQSSVTMCSKNIDTMLWSWKCNTNGIINIMENAKKFTPNAVVVNFSSLNDKPVNFYDVSKNAASQCLLFLSKKNKIPVIDIAHGNIYGLKSNDCNHDNLITRFPHDNTYGTIVNRLLYQAILNNCIIIHGDETREIAIIEINDFIKSVDICIKKLTKRKSKDRVSIFYEKVNVFTEKMKIKEIVNLAEQASKKYKLNLSLKHIKTTKTNIFPWKIQQSNDKILSWGLKPTMLSDNIETVLSDLIIRHKMGV